VIAVNFSYPSLEDPKPVSEEPAAEQLNGRIEDPEPAPEPPTYTPAPLAQPANTPAAAPLAQPANTPAVAPPAASPRHTPQVSYT